MKMKRILNEGSNWSLYASEAEKIFKEVGWELLKFSNEKRNAVQFLIRGENGGLGVPMQAKIYVGTSERTSVAAVFEGGSLTDVKAAGSLAKSITALKNLDTEALRNLAAEIAADDETFKLK